jgi:hypothetical protein
VHVLHTCISAAEVDFRLMVRASDKQRAETGWRRRGSHLLCDYCELVSHSLLRCGNELHTSEVTAAALWCDKTLAVVAPHETDCSAHVAVVE